MKICGVCIPNRIPNEPVNILIGDNNIIEVVSPAEIPPPFPGLLLPSLCHPHIHLDKPFLLSSHLPNYADLNPDDGTFQEALLNTSKAKSRYTDSDLMLRGSQLILESAQAGVTSMRAFVEVDHVTQFQCLFIGNRLKKEYRSICHVQLCAFAQDPVFSTEHGKKNRQLMENALEYHPDLIDALGSTPYVEDSHETALENIEWAITAAIAHKIHLDFHLDYDLSPDKSATIWDVIRLLKQHSWTSSNPDKTIAIGHCTHLTLFTHEELTRLASEIHDSNLPISFIGLPSSDLYMMGRPDPGRSPSSTHHKRPRGTLQIPSLIKDYGLNAAIGINNVGNAFTPFGSCDPLRIASMGVGIYQAGTNRDAEILYEAVSVRARKAIGLEEWRDEDIGVELKRGQNLHYGLLLIKNDMKVKVDRRWNEKIVCMEVEARQKTCVRDVVWEVPELAAREVKISLLLE